MLFFSFCLEVLYKNSVPIIEEEGGGGGGNTHTYHPQIKVFLSSSRVTFPLL